MRISGSPQGRVVVVTALLVVLVGGAVGWSVAPHDGERRTTSASPPAAGPGDRPEAEPGVRPSAGVAPGAARVGVLRAVGSLAVLREWDRSRSRAWARGDVGALRRLYRPGSAAGAADVAMLQRWVARGVRVEGMTMQVLAVELRRRTSDLLVLVVTDRLVGAEAVRGSSRRALPSDRATTRRMVFRRSGTRWLLDGVEVVDRAVADADGPTGQGG